MAQIVPVSLQFPISTVTQSGLIKSLGQYAKVTSCVCVVRRGAIGNVWGCRKEARMGCAEEAMKKNLKKKEQK